MGSKGCVSRKTLIRSDAGYKYLASNSNLQDIALERRTKANLEHMEKRISQMSKCIDYHVGLRNCEHFAYFVTGQITRSEQSVWHLFTDYTPFTKETMIHSFDQLRDALLRCRYCGPVALSKREFTESIFVNNLEENYFAYEFHHPLGGIHLYVSSVAKTDNLEASYDSVVLAYYGALAGRSEMLSIIQQLRGSRE